MTGFWKRLMGRRADVETARAEAEAVETPQERHITDEGVEGVAADEVVEEQLGGSDPQRLVDDEFTP